MKLTINRGQNWGPTVKDVSELRYAGARYLVFASTENQEAKLRCVAQVRFAKSQSGGTVWAVLQVYNPVSHAWIKASGKAGGGGYNRSSAAILEAIRNAGYVGDLSRLDGGGDLAIEQAVRACAIAEGNVCTGESLYLEDY